MDTRSDLWLLLNNEWGDGRCPRYFWTRPFSSLQPGVTLSPLGTINNERSACICCKSSRSNDEVLLDVERVGHSICGAGLAEGQPCLFFAVDRQQKLNDAPTPGICSHNNRIQRFSAIEGRFRPRGFVRFRVYKKLPEIISRFVDTVAPLTWICVMILKLRWRLFGLQLIFAVPSRRICCQGCILSCFVVSVLSVFRLPLSLSLPCSVSSKHLQKVKILKS